MKEYVIVTGASGKFGREVVRFLASEGVNLILINRRKVKSMTNPYPDVDIINIQHDLNDDVGSLKLANELNEKYEIDGIIYCFPVTIYYKKPSVSFHKFFNESLNE